MQTLLLGGHFKDHKLAFRHDGGGGSWVDGAVWHLGLETKDRKSNCIKLTLLVFLFRQQPRHMTFLHAAGVWWLFFLEPSPNPTHSQLISPPLLFLSFIIYFISLFLCLDTSLSLFPSPRHGDEFLRSLTKRRSRLDIDTVRQGCHVCFETVLALQTHGHSHTFTHSHTFAHAFTQTDTNHGRKSAQKWIERNL